MRCATLMRQAMDDADLLGEELDALSDEALDLLSPLTIQESLSCGQRSNRKPTNRALEFDVAYLAGASATSARQDQRAAQPVPNSPSLGAAALPALMASSSYLDDEVHDDDLDGFDLVGANVNQ